MDDHENWSEYKRLVLSELKRLHDTIEGIEKAIGKINTEIATLKAKAGIWGAIGASIPILTYILIGLVKGD